ncbi:hypothetical protein BC937DRAFT_86876 [Endogone sp. FLAS-F59071]|nr:hypothetical protein BC937DRAFT_86876 [Endogone sp. FLAS-F59071]|eukprot:RUS12852.1 hypothetical protein BC937DRAFT_86876 [Endogone sp. FLAS-F59071]
MVESTADYRTFVSNLSSDMAYGYLSFQSLLLYFIGSKFLSLNPGLLILCKICSQPIPTSLQYMMSAVQPEQLAEQYELMYGHAMAALKDAADHLMASELQAMHLRHEVEALERELGEQEEGGGEKGEGKEEEQEEEEGHRSNRAKSAIEAPATLGKKGRQVDLLA